MDFVLSTFVTTSEESRAVLTAMGCYVLTAVSLVAWVIYGLFRRTRKVLPVAMCLVLDPSVVQPGPVCRFSP